MLRRLRPTALLSVLLSCALLTTSCSTIEEPVVTLTGVDYVGISNEGLAFELLVDVANPNGFGADVSNLEYVVFVDDIQVAGGKQMTTVDVPAEEAIEVGIPFTVTWKGAKKGLKRLIDGKGHEWRLAGSVRVHRGAISRRFEFVESGEFDAPEVSDIEIDLDL
jgi:LEA14-like dessication related protein